jgi:preprotein translocase subunit SecG
MRLRYETGVATLVQFIVATFLGFLNGGNSIITGCHNSSPGECVSNTLVSLVLIILTVMWLGFLLALGYTAQERRSSRLALALIAAESLSALVYLFDAKHTPSILERLTNLIAFGLAIWVIFIAWRLSRAKGGRIVKTARARRRPMIRQS